MIIGLVIAVVCVAGALLVVERWKVRAIRRVDDLTGGLTGQRGILSASIDDAVTRLERATARQAEAGRDGYAASRYRAALDALTVGVAIVDERARVVYRNDYAQGFMQGRHGAALVGEAIDALIETARAGEAAEREVQVFGPPRRTLFITAAPIGGDAYPLGVLVVIDDVTEQQRLDAIRRDFVANISHELRTPIGAMALLAETMQDEADPELLTTLAGRLRAESERLARTVDDLLQLSRIEHADESRFEPVVIQHVLASAHDRVRNAAEQRNVEIGVVVPERPLVVRGDALQLGSALFNLLDNGIKYIGAEGGTVSVRARQLGDAIELVVQDSGIGIPRRDLDRVFERFYRVDQGRSRASGGTGLGLAIVRHVVVNHGGRIEVTSTEGEGTTFTMHLPAFVSGETDSTMPDDLDDGPTPPSPPDEGNDEHEVSRS